MFLNPSWKRMRLLPAKKAAGYSLEKGDRFIFNAAALNTSLVCSLTNPTPKHMLRYMPTTPIPLKTKGGSYADRTPCSPVP